jgi:hypothetical protein
VLTRSIVYTIIRTGTWRCRFREHDSGLVLRKAFSPRAVPASAFSLQQMDCIEYETRCNRDNRCQLGTLEKKCRVYVSCGGNDSQRLSPVGRCNEQLKEGGCKAMQRNRGRATSFGPDRSLVQAGDAVSSPLWHGLPTTVSVVLHSTRPTNLLRKLQFSPAPAPR